MEFMDGVPIQTRSRYSGSTPNLIAIVSPARTDTRGINSCSLPAPLGDSYLKTFPSLSLRGELGLRHTPLCPWKIQPPDLSVLAKLFCELPDKVPLLWSGSSISSVKTSSKSFSSPPSNERKLRAAISSAIALRWL